MTATANPSLMAPLQVIASKYNWNQLRVHHAATRANRFSKIAVLQDLKPRLILVPRTTGERDASELMNELLYAAESIDSEVINFTHYGFIQERLPQIEVESVFKKLAEKKGKTSIRVLIWDIDSRYLDQTRELYKRIFAVKHQGVATYETV
jgi:L-ascorbate metabolism protein UlaG (beta-lactamase superfamily)